MRIEDAISEGRELLKSSLEAEVILAYLTGFTREYLLTHGEDKITKGEKFLKLCKKRVSGIPLAYLTNHKEFFGLDFYVDERVLIPRPETELVVEEAISVAIHSIPSFRACREIPFSLIDIPLKGISPLRPASGRDSGRNDGYVCDVGTGSGCIAISLAKKLPNARFIAVDISSGALTAARKNAVAHGVSDRIKFAKSDLLKNVLNKPITGIVANLPYIANGDKFVDKEVRKYEPKTALFSGKTGLELFEKLFGQINGMKQKPSWLICEVGAGQKKSINALIKKHFGNIPVMWKNDLAGIPRVFTLLFNP